MYTVKTISEPYTDSSGHEIYGTQQLIFPNKKGRPRRGYKRGYIPTTKSPQTVNLPTQTVNLPTQDHNGFSKDDLYTNTISKIDDTYVDTEVFSQTSESNSFSDITFVKTTHTPTQDHYGLSKDDLATNTKSKTEETYVETEELPQNTEGNLFSDISFSKTAHTSTSDFTLLTEENLIDLFEDKYSQLKTLLNRNLASFETDELRQNVENDRKFAEFLTLRKKLTVLYTDSQNLLKTIQLFQDTGRLDLIEVKMTTKITHTSQQDLNFLEQTISDLVYKQNKKLFTTLLCQNLKLIKDLDSTLTHTDPFVTAKAFRTVVLTHKGLSDGLFLKQRPKKPTNTFTHSSLLEEDQVSHSTFIQGESNFHHTGQESTHNTPKTDEEIHFVAPHSSPHIQTSCEQKFPPIRSPHRLKHISNSSLHEDTEQDTHKLNFFNSTQAKTEGRDRRTHLYCNKRYKIPNTSIVPQTNIITEITDQFVQTLVRLMSTNTDTDLSKSVSSLQNQIHNHTKHHY